ncbi:hypothetical protein [Encephalitozoon cuniculi GB-M1]|uniref:UPF0328 protein ECU08_2080 n=1 Tax=Encephalitozoon cuniculi (strain GB-M1) TaxID=284813 RepID=Y808_ENCCU|nr:uncharacterized protein ECU08_2080 [Encephalitozoon cuniculi GB-M1]Q8SUH8.1 RecName: Full=UPF0328 protein ECU08_2080 [Encephalitozoon cuniculi GB-M1]CAD26510.1 hypothetical protein [Encephalitozoon cuniculi GB-M1]
MGIIDVQRSHLTATPSKERDAPAHPPPTILPVCILFPYTSIALPVLMYYIPEKGQFDQNPFLKLIAILPPCLYSAVQFPLLFLGNPESSCTPRPALYATLYLLLDASLLAFSAISILSIAAFTTTEWNSDEVVAVCSTLLPSLLVLPAHLLSTSCALTPGSIGFTDSSVDILIDLLMVSLLAAGLTLNVDESWRFFPYICISSLVLVLAKLLRKSSSMPRRDPAPAPAWRIAAFVLIFGLSMFVYFSILHECLLIFGNHFPWFPSQAPSNDLTNKW